jgi:Ca-activated chloride channel family protein
VTRKEEDTKVRLDSDAVGGELHVRASVIGDDGRAQSFRRLIVHVAGPDGFAREIALEASGAGSYAATVPLSRPGTYITVARDELSGEAVGTTGAVLTAGEELRPTGAIWRCSGRSPSSPAARSGTRSRASSATARRSASRTRTSRPTLLMLAAFALLLAVAARRLAMPDRVLAWQAAFLARWHRKAPRSSPRRCRTRRGRSPRCATRRSEARASGRRRHRGRRPQRQRCSTRRHAPRRPPVAHTPAGAPATRRSRRTHAQRPAAPAQKPANTARAGPPSSRPLTAARRSCSRGARATAPEVPVPRAAARGLTSAPRSGEGASWRAR